MNNFLLTLAAIVLFAIGALFAVPPMIDWNQYRGLFEEEVSRLLGREVRVGGGVRLRILPVPSVEFEKVMIADAPGISGPFVRADRFTLWLSVPPLLRGVIEARQIEIERPEVRLRFDENGGGNWQQITLQSLQLPFVPQQIALQSVNIHDGRVRIENAAGRNVVTLEKINGELSATEMAGPYKFIGTIAKAGGAPMEFRVSTAHAEADGSFRITATMRAPDSPARVSLDGTIAALDSRPEFAGKLQWRTRLTAGDPVGATGDGTGVVDLTASIKADTRQAAFDDLVVSFDSVGRPQNLRGAARVTWDESVLVDGRLTSKWLDLDTLFRLPAGGSRRGLLRQIVAGGLDEFTGRADLRLSIEQANLGGAAISGLSARVSHNGQALRLEHLHVGLPGGTTLAGDGVLAGGASDIGFQGHVIVKGDSLERFALWAQLPISQLSGPAARNFAISTAVKLDAASVALTDIEGEVGGGRIAGRLAYDWSDKPSLTIDGKLDSLDLAGFGSDLLQPEALGRLLLARRALGNLQDATGGSKRWPELVGIPIDIRLRGEDIGDGRRRIDSYDLALARTASHLDARRLRLRTASGLEIDASGAVELSGGLGGKLSGTVSSATGDGAGELFRFLGDVSNAGNLEALLGGAAPFSVAFTTSFGSAKSDKVTLELDGDVRGDRVWLQARTDGPIQNWRSQNARIAATISGANVFKSTGWLRSASEPGDVRGAVQTSAARAAPLTLRIDASGIPTQGLLAAAELDSEPLSAALSANVRLSAGDRMDWAGKLRLDTANLADALRILAPEFASLTDTDVVPVRGRVDIRRLADEVVEIVPKTLAIGGSRILGSVTVASTARRDSSEPRLAAKLSVDRADAATVLAPLLKKVAAGSDSEETRDGAPAFWTDRPFDLASLAPLAGKIELRIGELAIAPDLKLNKVDMAVQLMRGKLVVERLEARLRGAEASGSAELRQAAAGIDMKMHGAIRGIALQRFAAAGLENRFKGGAELSVELTGQGMSPRSLAAAARGQGTLTLAAVTLPGVDPVELVALAARIVNAESDPQDLAVHVTELAGMGAIALGDAALPVTIADGAARIGVAAVDQPVFRLQNRTTVDLLRWAVDSEWRIWPRLTATLDMPEARPLPEIQLVQTGPLARLSLTEPRVSVGTLQRELTVRRMEADVARLERLRREDEERAKSEAVRLQQLEQERDGEAERLRRQKSEGVPQPEPAGQRDSGTQVTGTKALEAAPQPPLLSQPRVEPPVERVYVRPEPRRAPRQERFDRRRFWDPQYRDGG
jgi:uncharacterized protein involved in outer membrane biogenesis